MMKNKILFSALILGACAFQACQNVNRNGNDPDSLNKSMVDSSQVAMSDTAGMNNNDTASFMHKAAIGGMMEVDLGKIAQQQSSNPKVKDFGALMVKDHSKVNAELKGIADAKQVTLPTTYPADVQGHIDEMKKLSGADFDKHYMSMMVEDHVEDINLFKEATKNSDADISNFATKNLPTLETHHQKATAINSSLK